MASNLKMSIPYSPMLGLLKWPLTIASHSPPSEDTGVKHEAIDESRNPSTGDMQLHVEKASSVWKNEIEQEVGGLTAGLVQISRSVIEGDGSKFHVGVGSGPGVGAGAAPKKSAKAAQGKMTLANKDTPMIIAARVRTKSAKDFVEALALLDRAETTAEELLNSFAPELLGSAAAVEEDLSLSLMRSRLALVKLAKDMSTGQRGAIACQKLYAEAVKDPYLKDMRTTILASEEGVQTAGMVKYFRDVTLELHLAPDS